MPQNAAEVSQSKKPPVNKIRTTVKGGWSVAEDDKIRELVGLNGPRGWSTIASELPGRRPYQCRDRWQNILDPSIKKGNWTREEDEKIIKLQEEMGNRYSLHKIFPKKLIKFLIFCI